MTDSLFADTNRTTYFIEVILPLSIPKTYTYRVPLEHNDSIEIGKRVIVQFGKSKIYTAIILSVSETAPTAYEAKYLMDVIDDQPIVNIKQLEFWHWIADYYLCYLGEVMAAALPTALKLASETKIILNKEHVFDKAELSDKEYVLTEALEIQNELTISEISKILGQKTVFPILRSLFNKHIIYISEEIIEKYKVKKLTLLQLNSFYNDAENRKELFNILEKAPKQLDVLLAYLKLIKQNKEISKAMLMEASGAGSSIIKALVERDIFTVIEKEISRLPNYEEDIFADFTLNEEQQSALSLISESFKTQSVTLLHGITSSGKTQIYIRLIEAAITKQDQVLYLLPEIALTTQIIERLKKYFGNKIGVYHSRFNDNERAEVWQKVLSGEFKIILGARSAVFLPFKNLSLIIVDEEHEASYKQYDPAPRYNARDTAIILGSLHQAKVLLGSATPSIETYNHAKEGKYGFVELLKRFGGVKLPAIEVVSIAEQNKKKLIQENFSDVLLKEINTALELKEQVILFQNRRGYVPVLICKTCGNTPKCINCDVSLTYHKSSGKMHCHYCGYREEHIVSCPACGSNHLEQKGFGTEKIEDDLKILVPDTKIGRMDYDTTRNKFGHQHLLNDFEEGRINILVGTQMVAKGLDFGNVTLIGIINADSMLKFPDFRAFERSFQMLSQVAGRAGRRDKQGKVIIQTYDAAHRIIKNVVDNDYKTMFTEELKERKIFKYPPFYRLIQIDVKHKDAAKLHNIANNFAATLKNTLKDKVLGPQVPLVGRIRNYYIQSIIIKIDRQNQSVPKIKEFLKEKINEFNLNKQNAGGILQVDVDPY